MNKVLLFVAMLLVTFANAQPQRICGSMENLDRLKTEDPTLAARMQEIENQTASYLQKYQTQNTTNAVITIPVVFHVVYSTTAQNISDAKCIAQLNQLNLDYARLNADRTNTPAIWQGIAANTQIQFCLAQRDPSGNATTGIERRQTTTTSFSTNDYVKHYANGGLNAWPSTSYLNLWSCNLGNGVLGYAQFPGGSAANDGVVLLYSSVGSVASPGPSSSFPYNLGRTATHEVGHWLNLYHIWGDEAQCSGSDNVGDTPNQGPENYGCPSFPHTDNCQVSSPGVMFMNYMDYTDDNCMNMFTAGQSTRMNALFATGGARVSLLSSLGCQAPTTTCGVPSGLSANSVTTNSATLNWTAVSGATSYTVQYKTTSATTWTSVTASTNSYSLTGLAAATSYDFQVRAICSAGTSAFSSTTTFTTLSDATCGTPAGLTTSAITTTSATISWSVVTGASSYNIQYKLSSATTWTTTTSATNSKLLSGLTSAQSYQWKVQAVCSSGVGAYSSVATFTTSASGCSDNFEPNNTYTASASLPTNTTVSGLINTSTDVDWFKVTTAYPYTKLKITLTNLPADYDVKLYNSSLNLLSVSQNGSTTSETIIYNATAGATYYIKVYGYNYSNNTSLCYALRASVSSINFKQAGEIDEPVVEVENGTMKLYPNPVRDNINLVFNSATDEKASIRVFDMVGKTVYQSSVDLTTGENKFTFDLGDLTPGIYFAELQNSTDRVVNKFILEK